jgi:hypothetical protein
VDNNAWLKELKEGDPVLVASGGWRGTDRRLGIVKSRTPTGRVNVQCDGMNYEQTFRPDGQDMRAPGKWDSRDYLEQYTAEKYQAVLDKKEREALVYKLREYMFAKESLAQLRAIVAILREGKPEAKGE